MRIHYIFFGLIVFIFSSCGKNDIGQYSTDSIPPGEVKSPEVKNVPGGAIISYIIPDDDDLLYVKAVYTLPNGKVMEQKASAYTSSLAIEGFGKSNDIAVTLIAGDRSKNESKPTVVMAHPLDAAIYSIIKTVSINSDFGGIRLDWQNPYQADIVVCVITTDSTNTTAGFVTAENFYSNAKIARSNIRGYPSEQRVFGVYLRDRWGNVTDTVKGQYLPLIEQEVTSYMRWNPPGIPYSEYGTAYSIEKLWDNNILTFHLEQAKEFPSSFTFDLGKIVKLSRVKQTQRQGVTLIYTSQNVNKFEIWGSATSNVTNDFSGWFKLGDFVAHKPSGGAEGINTAEDIAFATTGEDFNIDPSALAVRYIRYVVLDTWSHSLNWSISELKFFGNIQ